MFSFVLKKEKKTQGADVVKRTKLNFVQLENNRLSSRTATTTEQEEDPANRFTFPIGNNRLVMAHNERLVEQRQIGSSTVAKRSASWASKRDTIILSLSFLRREETRVPRPTQPATSVDAQVARIIHL